MATVQEILTKWSFKADDKALARIDKGIKSVASGVAILAGAATAVVGAVSAMAYGTIKAADELSKTSQAIGVSTDALQKLRYAGGLAGVEVQQLNVGLMRFSRTLLDARDGEKMYVDALRRVGLTTEQIGNKTITTDGYLALIADKFATMPNGAEKTAAAMEVFGRSGARLIPLLNGGSSAMHKLYQEAEELGFIMGEDLIKQAEATKDNIGRLQYAVQSLKNRIGAGLLPKINDLIGQVLKWYVANKKIIDQNINEFVDQLIIAFKYSITILKGVGTTIKYLANIFGGFKNLLTAVTIAILAFAGVKIVTGIYSLALAVKGLGIAFDVAGATATAAWLPMVAIMGKIAIILLAMEDFYNFIARKKSLIGKIFGVDPEKDFNRRLNLLKQLTPADITALGSVGAPVSNVTSNKGGSRTFAPNITINAHGGNAKDIRSEIEKIFETERARELRQLDEQYQAGR